MVIIKEKQREYELGIIDNTNKELTTIKGVVRSLMKSDVRCRNDDKWLTYRVMRNYTNIYIPFEDFKKIPSFDSIRRVRQVIQNKEGEFLPTIQSVIDKRKKREHTIKGWLYEEA